MAVARMLNVTAISHASATGELIDVLRRAGVLDITQDAYDLPAPVDAATEASVRELDELIADAQFTASFLKRFHESDALLSAFISEKLHLAADY